MSDHGALNYLTAEMRRLAHKSWAPIAAYMVIATAPYVLLDNFRREDDVAYALTTLIVAFLGYPLLVAILRSGGYLTEGRQAGFWTYLLLLFLLGLLSGIAMLLFILPGLYVMMRWLPAYARTMATSDSADLAMRWSWDKTKRVQAPLITLMLLPVLAIVCSIALVISADLNDAKIGEAGEFALLAASNILWSLSSVLVTLLGIATYGLLIDHRPSLEDVFS